MGAGTPSPLCNLFRHTTTGSMVFFFKKSNLIPSMNVVHLWARNQTSMDKVLLPARSSKIVGRSERDLENVSSSHALADSTGAKDAAHWHGSLGLVPCQGFTMDSSYQKNAHTRRERKEVKICPPEEGRKRMVFVA